MDGCASVHGGICDYQRFTAVGQTVTVHLKLRITRTGLGILVRELTFGWYLTDPDLTNSDVGFYVHLSGTGRSGGPGATPAVHRTAAPPTPAAHHPTPDPSPAATASPDTSPTGIPAGGGSSPTTGTQVVTAGGGNAPGAGGSAVFPPVGVPPASCWWRARHWP